MTDSQILSAIKIVARLRNQAFIAMNAVGRQNASAEIAAERDASELDLIACIDHRGMRASDPHRSRVRQNRPYSIAWRHGRDRLGVPPQG
jgi:hypothetical protein